MAELDEFYLTDLVHSGTLLESASGDLETITGLTNLQQALFHRLITIRGSLIHRPEYGVGIKQYQNAVGSLATQRKIAAEIDEQFRQDFRVQDVLSVNIVQDKNESGKFTVTVKVQTAGYTEAALTFKPFGED